MNVGSDYVNDGSKNPVSHRYYRAPDTTYCGSLSTRITLYINMPTK